MQDKKLNTVGIILAAGKSTRLRPASCSVPKPILPVYDKPSIFYSISLLIRMGINKIGVVCAPEMEEIFKDTLIRFNAGNLWIHIIPTANMTRGVLWDLYNAADFCRDADRVVLTFPDNIFIGEDFDKDIKEFNVDHDKFQSIITYSLTPEKFGCLNPDGTIIEKPQNLSPTPNVRIVTGIYKYPTNAIFDEYIMQFAAEKSKNDNLSITDLNNRIIQDFGAVYTDITNTCTFWYDIGTAENMLEASRHVQGYYRNTHELMGCIEIEAYKQGFYSEDDVRFLNTANENTEYARYVLENLQK